MVAWTVMNIFWGAQQLCRNHWHWFFLLQNVFVILTWPCFSQVLTKIHFFKNMLIWLHSAHGFKCWSYAMATRIPVRRYARDSTVQVNSAVGTSKACFIDASCVLTFLSKAAMGRSTGNSSSVSVWSWSDFLPGDCCRQHRESALTFS